MKNILRHGKRTLISRVTGGDTSHYTMTDACTLIDHKLYKLYLYLLNHLQGLKFDFFITLKHHQITIFVCPWAFICNHLHVTYVSLPLLAQTKVDIVSTSFQQVLWFQSHASNYYYTRLFHVPFIIIWGFMSLIFVWEWGMLSYLVSSAIKTY